MKSKEAVQKHLRMYFKKTYRRKNNYEISDWEKKGFFNLVSNLVQKQKNK